MEAVLHIVGYQMLRHNSRIMFDPSYHNIDQSNFWECNWTDFCVDAVEAIPPSAKLSREKEVDLCMFVDGDHAGNKRTRRSRTGFMIYMDVLLIDWYSKKQSTIDLYRVLSLWALKLESKLYMQSSMS